MLVVLIWLAGFGGLLVILDSSFIIGERVVKWIRKMRKHPSSCPGLYDWAEDDAA